MIIGIEDKLYRLKTGLQDVSIKEYAEVEKIVKDTPAWFRNIMQDIEDEMDIEILLDYEKKIVSVLLDIPEDVIERCAIGDIHLCAEASKEIVLSCIRGIYAEPLEMFVWGDKFNAPQKDTDIAGNIMYCSEITALQICEASDLQIATGFEYANNIVTILCCDKYDEKEAKRKAEGLKDMPVSIAAGCMAHLSKFHEYCLANYPNVYGGRGKETPLSGFGWGGRILWLAGSVENVEKVNNMNAYEFIRQLSYKIAENES